MGKVEVRQCQAVLAALRDTWYRLGRPDQGRTGRGPLLWTMSRRLSRRSVPDLVRDLVRDPVRDPVPDQVRPVARARSGESIAASPGASEVAEFDAHAVGVGVAELGKDVQGVLPGRTRGCEVAHRIIGVA